MTAEKIRKSITVKSEPSDNNTVLFTAKLTLFATQTVDNMTYGGISITEIEERLRKHIMNAISEDRGLELYHALNEYASINPMDSSRSYEARKKLMALSRYQPPKVEGEKP